MATTKLFLDTRATVSGVPAPIKILLCLQGKSTSHSTGIKVLPEQWDKATCKVIKHPQRQYLNLVLSSHMNDWEMTLLKLTESGEAKKAKSVAELKRKILMAIDPEEYSEVKAGTFLKHFKEFTESRDTEGTRTVYERTRRKMEQFDPKLNEKAFEEIDRKWLKDFERFLSETTNSANSRAIHFRNIRAVFNDAIDDEITASYPFRKFKIKSQPTAKRSLGVEQLRLLKDYPCEEYQVIYRDMFMLMFYLCGINAVDLLNAAPDAMMNGRLEYIRAKTHKPYSVKIEPEAMEIIEKYKGTKYLLNIMDERLNYMDFLHRMDRALKQIGPMVRRGLGGKKIRTPLFPKLSQYWCRHSWATTAASLDIPKETIAAGLGHGGGTVTDIYIRFDQKKVDVANRRVIDYVLYDKI